MHKQVMIYTEFHRVEAIQAKPQWDLTAYPRQCAQENFAIFNSPMHVGSCTIRHSHLGICDENMAVCRIKPLAYQVLFIGLYHKLNSTIYQIEVSIRDQHLLGGVIQSSIDW